MRRELAAVVARSPFGQGAAWPVVETVQSDGICVEVLAPAPDSPTAVAEEAERLALRIAGELGVVGVLAVELFETDRPARCWSTSWRCVRTTRAHWTIEGARTSQFEQHLRAVLDYPLGATDAGRAGGGDGERAGRAGPTSRPALDERVHHLSRRAGRDLKIHLYGKQLRPGRKVGHVTALGRGPGDAARGRDGGGRVPGHRSCRDEVTHQLRPGGRRDHGQRLGLAGDVGRPPRRWPSSTCRTRCGWSRPTAPRGTCSTTRPAAAGRGLRVIIAGAGGAAHLPGHGGGLDAAAGDRRAGAAQAPGRAGLAAVDRADAGRDPGRDRRRSAAPATPACSRCASWPRPTSRCGRAWPTSRPAWPRPPGPRTSPSATASIS